MMSKQNGFYYDAGRCIQCRTCEVACKSANNIEPGVKWRRVIETWGGNYPDVTRTFFSLACMHCEEPACIAICPTGAIRKRVEDGIVVVDKDKCNGCQDCFTACPYDVPQFGKDGKMQKCDYCTGIAREPACVESCPAEALYAGTIDDLLEMAKGKTARKMDGATKPSIVIAS
jgi:anaerobic dimethyl sulfoxide reductase subunit B (iron-sulfur subunit)